MKYAWISFVYSGIQHSKGSYISGVSKESMLQRLDATDNQNRVCSLPWWRAIGHDAISSDVLGDNTTNLSSPKNSNDSLSSPKHSNLSSPCGSEKRHLTNGAHDKLLL
jgi:hypothetical protein